MQGPNILLKRIVRMRVKARALVTSNIWAPARAGGRGVGKLTCTQISDDVMPSEIVCFRALRPLPSAFRAILESSLPR